MTLEQFVIIYNRRVLGPNRTEPPGHSPRGVRDKPNTHRAVYKVEGLINEYAGMITNPPYPAIIGSDRKRRLKWVLPAMLGLATGLAALPLVRALRARLNE